jgi:putative nucleotidyltransferase with HDIG domain
MQELASPESQEKTPIRFTELHAGKSVTAERSLVTKSGALIPVEISGKKLDNGNFLGIVRDITERKHHELEREAIITVSNALRQTNTRAEIISVILDQLIKLFDADGAVLVLPNPQTGGLIDEMGRGAIGERMSGLNIPPGKGICDWVIKNKTPYLNNKADEDPLFYRPDLLGQSKCIAAAPLITQEQSIGALWIARQADIMEQDVSLMTAIADIAANAIHRVILHEQTEQQLHHLLALHQIDLAITTNLDSNLTLNIIMNNVKDELEVDAASILLLNPVTHMLEYTAGIGFRTNRIKQSQVRLGDETAGRAAQEYRTISFPDLNTADKTLSRYSLLVDEGFTSHHVTPLVVKGLVKGVLEVFHRKPVELAQGWFDYFETLATQAAIAIENASLVENLQRSNIELILAYDATIEGWSRALDLRDKETEGHTQRVTEMALKLAEKMGMSDIEKLDLRRGALLHDIGKMGIPDSILHKPGTLTKDEWDIMRQHPSYAYQMLSPISYLKRAIEISYCHHEKWDGSGYPRGLKGEEIPLSARLFAVVDVFDALTSDRPYRKAWSHEDTYRYIEEQAGKHFDPQIVKIFLESKQT